jgi:prephenate dehydratase
MTMSNNAGAKRIAIQGIHGCFHEMAARKFYGEDAIIVECKTFPELCKSVKSGESDAAVMAIENTIAGTLLQNYSLLQDFDLKINGEVFLNIQMNLMALPGVTLEQIDTIQSHPIANRQCAEFLSTLPQATIVDMEDTALAAKQVSEQKLATTAAIGNTLTAELYGLEILEKRIETHKKNFTRFLALAPVQHHDPDANKASLCFQLGHTPGSLADTLVTFKNHNLNLTKIQSVPIIGKPYEYNFHVDLEWKNRPDFDAAMKQTLATVANLSVLGTYRKGTLIGMID